MAGWAIYFLTWILGFIAALSGHQTPSPVVGSLFQKWFAGAFP
jgi:hypothetical protein